MDSPPPSSERLPSAPVAPKRRRALRRFLLVTASLLAILAVLFLVFASSNEQFVWLTPAQMAQASHPGPLMQLKYKLIRLAGPLMRYYHRNRPNIITDSTIMRFTPAALTPPMLGAPFITNGDGMSAWIISPAEVATFRRFVNGNSNVVVVSRPRIQTASGGSARAMIGQNITVPPGGLTNIGITLDTTAIDSSGSVKLLLGASSTELLGRPVTNLLIKTNFSAACRAFVPDAGALVLNCRNADPTNPTNYWLIVSPVLVDATGKPIKH